MERTCHDGDMDSLADSVRSNGVIIPLVVREASDNKYELISGNRRLAAAKKVGLSTVPCIIMKLNDAESMIYTLTENFNRKNLTLGEEIDMISRLAELDIDVDEISKKTGRSEDFLRNKLKLSEIFYENIELSVKNCFFNQECSVKINDAELIADIINYIINSGTDVSKTEYYANSFLSLSLLKPVIKFKKLKDIKIFANTINHAVDTMRQAGIDVFSSVKDSDEYYEYTVRISKMTTSPVSTLNAV